MLKTYRFVRHILKKGKRLLKNSSETCYGHVKGSLHEREKTEIVWSFAKPGGVTPNQTPKRFPAFSLEKNGNCTKLR